MGVALRFDTRGAERPSCDRSVLSPKNFSHLRVIPLHRAKLFGEHSGEIARENKGKGGKRAIAAAGPHSVRASTGENEVRETKVLFVHQKVMYSLKYNYFLFHIYESKLLSCSYFEV